MVIPYILRKLKDYPGYSIGEDGKVFDEDGVQRPEYLTGIPPYKYVNLPDKNAVKGWQIKRVHILVAQAFIPNPLGLPMVNHIDEDKMNCHYSNLEWCTQSHNHKHSLASRVKVYKTNKLSLAEKKAMVEEYIASGRVSKRAIYMKYNTHQSVLDKALREYDTP